jgi:hypothetical protein
MMVIHSSPPFGKLNQVIPGIVFSRWWSLFLVRLKYLLWDSVSHTFRKSVKFPYLWVKGTVLACINNGRKSQNSHPEQCKKPRGREMVWKSWDHCTTRGSTRQLGPGQHQAWDCVPQIVWSERKGALERGHTVCGHVCVCPDPLWKRGGGEYNHYIPVFLGCFIFLSSGLSWDFFFFKAFPMYFLRIET